MTHDLIILDLMLGRGLGGEHLIVEFKKQFSRVPILVLSALSSVETKVEMINLGADDYLTKPFDAEELIARLKALYRRYLQMELQDGEQFGEFTFFRKQHRIVRGDKSIVLTRKENEIFEMLLRNVNRTVTTEDLLKIWDAKPGYHSNIVPSLVRRLRKKFDEEFHCQPIENKHGVGYALNVAC